METNSYYVGTKQALPITPNEQRNEGHSSGNIQLRTRRAARYDLAGRGGGLVRPGPSEVESSSARSGDDLDLATK